MRCRSTAGLELVKVITPPSSRVLVDEPCQIGQAGNARSQDLEQDVSMLRPGDLRADRPEAIEPRDRLRKALLDSVVREEGQAPTRPLASISWSAGSLARSSASRSCGE